MKHPSYIDALQISCLLSAVVSFPVLIILARKKKSFYDIGSRMIFNLILCGFLFSVFMIASCYNLSGGLYCQLMFFMK